MKRFINYLPAIALTMVIPLLSLLSPSRLPGTSALHFTGLDKVIHAAIYAALTCAWAYTFSAIIRSSIICMFATAFMVALYGLFMEVCQYLFTTTRSMDIFDALANLGGSLTAAIAIYVLSRRVKSPLKGDKALDLLEVLKRASDKPND
jgi:VanZ family protein